jgi:hypothetical protein
MHSKLGARGPGCSGNDNGLLGQHHQVQQYVVVGVYLNFAPEIAALKRINLLGVAQDGTTLHEINAGVEDGRDCDILSNRPTVREHVQRVKDAPGVGFMRILIGTR